MSSVESEDAYKMLNIYMGKEEKKKKKSKYYTYNLSGFPLALQKALFPWDVENFEKGTNYFKSLNQKYVCGPLIDKKREKLVVPRSEEEEDLGFDNEGGDNQTGRLQKGDEQDDDVVGDMGVGNNVNDKDVEELNSVGEVAELGKGVQQDGHAIAEVGKGGEEDDVFGEVDGAFEGGDGVGSDGLVVRDATFESGKGDKQEDAEQGVGSDGVVVVDVAFEGRKGHISDVDVQGFGSEGVVVGDAAFESNMVEESGKQSILNLDEYPSPSMCFIAQNIPNSVVALDGADPDFEYRDIDKQRGRKRSRWLESPWTDPMPKKKRKPQSNVEKINLVEFTSFLKNEDQHSLYTGQILQMMRQDFLDLVNIEKWISDLHIHSYFDILWRRQSSSELNYLQNIGLVNTFFLTNLNIKWAIEMDTLEAMRKIAKFKKVEEERRQQKETGSPPSPPQKKDRKKRARRSAILLLMLSMCSSCATFPWVLYHLLLKEGKVLIFDSLNERDGTSYRLKDIHALLFLLPSLLKHAGYYEEIKMDPHASPFTVQSMHSELIPQQDDGSHWLGMSTDVNTLCLARAKVEGEREAADTSTYTFFHSRYACPVHIPVVAAFSVKVLFVYAFGILCGMGT
ncbi:hypothetical protein Dsin_008917 [Dipteronia sinensis]|uniref:Ubiquitin-like protease family profile domain-containing protein n=1 Tax=Dipteronia sinensis TaxID=43782 RepID=A0AAE0AQV8_9ROSI|nr:hypothetical protein Dsin_008917 [Dipteronia sinensis]